MSQQQHHHYHSNSHHHHHHQHNYHHSLPRKSVAAFDQPQAPQPTSLQPKVEVLARINFWITLFPFTLMSLALLLLFFKADLLHEHVKQSNETFYAKAVDEFLSLEKEQQWRTYLIQYSWQTAELVLAYVLVRGTKKRDYGYLKAWLLLMTISFLVELSIQGSLLTNFQLNLVTIMFLVVYGLLDLYRFSCLFIVYLLVDEILERGEVARDRSRGRGGAGGLGGDGDGESGEE